MRPKSEQIYGICSINPKLNEVSHWLKGLQFGGVSTTTLKPKARTFKTLQGACNYLIKNADYLPNYIVREID